MERITGIQGVRRENAQEAVRRIERQLSEIPDKKQQLLAHISKQETLVAEADNAIKALEITQRFYNPGAFDADIKSATDLCNDAAAQVRSFRQQVAELDREYQKLVNELGVLNRFLASS